MVEGREVRASRSVMLRTVLRIEGILVLNQVQHVAKGTPMTHSETTTGPAR